MHEHEREFFWDDLRVAANMVTVSGSQFTQPPVWARICSNEERGPSYSGLFAYKFEHDRYDRGMIQNAHFHAQLPHRYREGTPIEPHVHVRLDPYSEGEPGQTILLEFEYIWVNVGEKRPVSSSIVAINHTVSEDDLRNDNLLISFGQLEKKDATISSMLDCRFSRITFDPSWEKNFWSPAGLSNDTFMGDLIFKEFDFHYQIDIPGSRELYTK
jgi:hypothetical protein